MQNNDNSLRVKLRTWVDDTINRDPALSEAEYQLWREVASFVPKNYQHRGKVTIIRENPVNKILFFDLIIAKMVAFMLILGLLLLIVSMFPLLVKMWV